LADSAVLDGLSKAAQIAAIAIAGAWVFFKTLRFRTFIPHLQPKVSANVIQYRGTRYLLIDMQVQNTGTSMARIHGESTVLTITALRCVAGKEPEEMLQLSPQHSIYLELFRSDDEKPGPSGRDKEQAHMLIEPGTIVYSQEIVEVPVERYDAFRIELRVSAPQWRLFSRKRHRKWRAWAIASLEPSNEKKENKGGGKKEP